MDNARHRRIIERYFRCNKRLPKIQFYILILSPKVRLINRKRTGTCVSVPKFSHLEVMALSMTVIVETESIVGGKWLFEYKLQEYKSKVPRRWFYDYRKKNVCLREEICKNIAMKTEGGERSFFANPKPIWICRLIRGNVVRWDARVSPHKLPTLDFVRH